MSRHRVRCVKEVIYSLSTGFPKREGTEWDKLGTETEILLDRMSRTRSGTKPSFLDSSKDSVCGLDFSNPKYEMYPRRVIYMVSGVQSPEVQVQRGSQMSTYT